MHYLPPAPCAVAGKRHTFRRPSLALAEGSAVRHVGRSEWAFRAGRGSQPTPVCCASRICCRRAASALQRIQGKAGHRGKAEGGNARPGEDGAGDGALVHQAQPAQYQAEQHQQNEEAEHATAA